MDDETSMGCKSSKAVSKRSDAVSLEEQDEKTQSHPSAAIDLLLSDAAIPNEMTNTITNPVSHNVRSQRDLVHIQSVHRANVSRDSVSEMNLEKPNDSPTHSTELVSPTCHESSKNSKAQSRSKKHRLFVMNIAVKGHGSQPLSVYQDDDPLELATKFGTRFGVSEGRRRALARHIRAHMETVQLTRVMDQALRKHPEYSDSENHQNPKTERFTGKGLPSATRSWPVTEEGTSAHSLRISLPSGHSPRVARATVTRLRRKQESNGRKLSRSESLGSWQPRRLLTSKQADSLFTRLHKDWERLQDDRHERQKCQMDLAMRKIQDTRIGMCSGSTRIAGKRSRQDPVCDRLYKQGIRSLREREKAAEAHHALLLRQEIDSAPFRPHITSLARALQRQAHAHADWWSGFVRANQQRASARKNDLAKQLEQSELQECTFNPGVDKHSRKILRSTSIKRDLTSRVYQPNRRQPEDPSAEQCTFHPRLSVRTYKLAARARSVYSSAGEVCARVNAKCVASLSDEYTTTHDLRTGEKLFTPKIGKYPDVRVRKSPIGDYLHALPIRSPRRSSQDHSDVCSPTGRPQSAGGAREGKSVKSPRARLFSFDSQDDSPQIPRNVTTIEVTLPSSEPSSARASSDPKSAKSDSGSTGHKSSVSVTETGDHKATVASSHSVCRKKRKIDKSSLMVQRAIQKRFRKIFDNLKNKEEPSATITQLRSRLHRLPPEDAQFVTDMMVSQRTSPGLEVSEIRFQALMLRHLRHTARYSGGALYELISGVSSPKFKRKSASAPTSPHSNSRPHPPVASTTAQSAGAFDRLLATSESPLIARHEHCLKGTADELGDCTFSPNISLTKRR
eukprot:797337_1